MSDTITYGGVKFIRHTETYEIRKNQTGKIQYYTRIDTGESGMSVIGLANACGIALLALQKLLDNPIIFEKVTTKTEQNKHISLDNKEKEVTTKPHDFYLIKVDNAHVVRDIFCERVIYYYAFESNYKKTKAKELYQSLAQHGLRVFIQSKTGYKIEQAANHDNSLTLSIDEQLKKEVAELKLKLAEQTTLNAEQAEKIRKLEYRPIYEKTHQAHLHAQWGGTREFYVGGPY